MLWIRRLHMYSSLVMLPWVILYAVTAMLFNHPTWFGDAPYVSYGPSDLHCTTLVKKEDLQSIAQKVVEVYASSHDNKGGMKLTSKVTPRYSRDFAFAVCKRDGEETSILLDVVGNYGTVRTQPVVAPKKETPAPFAVGKSNTGFTRQGSSALPKSDSAPEKIEVPDGLHEKFLAAIPVILEKTRMPGGAITVTSVPDLIFSVEFDGQPWQAQFNALTGSLQGRLLSEVQPAELGWRRFLLRLHTMHGFNGGMGPRWFWSTLVDVVSLAMLFWACSGVWMWWQVRSTRWPGVTLLAAGFSIAIWLAAGLHSFFLIPVSR
ncbi:MAG: hypothetical protein ACK5E4_11300 [Planctomycetia bacterium]